ncbi:Response regulator receiver protein [Hyella patelloides LEGE 07179]|uniref:Response regulator receiver protein n=1 Tax=Hyella patelloides LEGE 07179 TaxID=945734 RepID=A0A563VU03_9CYAN|nr:response regulator [Hyella patelloides]VEP14952.1 Response regulator receiver protein [Hyella patelloides LEGE 07179]
MNTVLVVEDCLVDRKAIEFSLKQNGFEVLTAQNGEEAIQKLRNYQPDVIILDILLPGYSGFEICRQFKTDPKTKKIPIVFCSSKATELDKFWGLKQGADAYLTKPIVSQEIIPIINQVINRQTFAGEA